MQSYVQFPICHFDTLEKLCVDPRRALQYMVSTQLNTQEKSNSVLYALDQKDMMGNNLHLRFIRHANNYISSSKADAVKFLKLNYSITVVVVHG